MTIEPIRHAVTVEAPPEDAFAAFTGGMNAWWPRDQSWSGELLERIGVEPRAGGFCYEIGPHGMRLDWGRVSRWEPPHRLAFSWQIGPDRRPEPNPGRSSEVDVGFVPDGEGTRVELVHDGWERHGGDAAGYRHAVAQAGTWATMLERYAAVVERRHESPWEAVTT